MSSDNSSIAQALVNDTGIPFVHPPEILAVAILLPLLGMLVVSLRFQMRRFTNQGFRSDDWTILAALPLTTAMAAMMIYGVSKHSLGYPSTPYSIPKPSFAEEELTETTPQQKVVFIVYWTTWMLLIPANGLIKLSAILMYRRVFVVYKHTVIDIVTKAMFIVCLLWTIGFFFAQLFGCGRAFWKPFGTEEDVATCRTNVRLNGLMISDLLTDILVWIVPIPVVWTLNMNVARKLAVTGILLLATISIIAAIIRLKVEIGIADGGYSLFVDGDQILTVNVYYSNIESSLALIAACLPTMNATFLRQRLGFIFRTVRNSTKTDQSSPGRSNINVTTEILTTHKNEGASEVDYRRDLYGWHDEEA